MKIYTKRGDLGETDLFGGGRVQKTHPQVEAYGWVDTANTALGSCFSYESIPPILKDRLEAIMGFLFSMGAELATAQSPQAHKHLTHHLKHAISLKDIETLEAWIDEAQSQLQPLKNFILPAGCELASRFHQARVQVRTAERVLVALNQIHPLRSELLQYLNRLSDLLFVWARLSNAFFKTKDLEWHNF